MMTSDGDRGATTSGNENRVAVGAVGWEGENSAADVGRGLEMHGDYSRSQASTSLSSSSAAARGSGSEAGQEVPLLASKDAAGSSLLATDSHGSEQEAAGSSLLATDSHDSEQDAAESSLLATDSHGSEQEAAGSSLLASDSHGSEQEAAGSSHLASDSHGSEQDAAAAALALKEKMEALSILAAVEKDAVAVAHDLEQLLHGLQEQLFKISSNTLQMMSCQEEAAGKVQDAALDAATAANRFINDCLRLNEEMRAIAPLAAKSKRMRQMVDRIEAQANLLFPP